MQAGSEVEGEAEVDLAAGHVVGDGVGDAVDVGHPVVVADVGDVKQVKQVDTGPEAFDKTVRT